MRLATLARPDATTTAAVLDEEGAHPLPGLADVGALLASPDWEARARAAAEGPAEAYGEADLRNPVPAPGAVVCVGLNYRTHILEMGRELPTDPTLFSKLPRALTDPYADIPLPAASAMVDYEAELAVVIGSPGRDVAAAEALSHVAGYTVLNDTTMRDFQKRTMQWFAGKTFEASTRFGPWIVTPEELGDQAGHELSLTVNGEERQRADVSDLVFGVADLIADLSRIVTLRPGDIIATGTPGGVGFAQEKFLADGDVVEVTIDGIGSIRNRLVGPR